MNFRTFTLAAATLTLAACAGNTTLGTAAGGSSAKALTTEAAFREAIVGKTLDFRGNMLIVNADNTVSGRWNNKNLTGTWTWDNGAWCREIKIEAEIQPSDCQTWEVDGDVARVSRSRGAGTTFSYFIRA